MAAIYFENDVAVRRHLDVADAAEAAAKYGGAESDYATGDFPVGSTRDPGTGVVTPWTTPAAEIRAMLSAEITAEQERRRVDATLSIPISAETTLTQALDARTLDYLSNFNRLWTEGRVAASYTIQTDQAAATLSAGQVRLIALASDDYVAALPVASAARHQALATTVDADLAAFDPALEAAWPSRTVAVDLAQPPVAPGASLEDRLAAIETRLNALEAV